MMPKNIIVKSSFIVFVGILCAFPMSEVEAGKKDGTKSAPSLLWSPLKDQQIVRPIVVPGQGIRYGVGCTTRMISCLASESLDNLTDGISGNELDTCIRGSSVSGVIDILKRRECDRSCPPNQSRVELSQSEWLNLVDPYPPLLFDFRIPIVCERGNVQLDRFITPNVTHCQPDNEFPYEFTSSPPPDPLGLGATGTIIYCRGGRIRTISIPGLHSLALSGHSCVYLGGHISNGGKLSGESCLDLGGGDEICVVQVTEDSGNCVVEVELR